MASTPPALNNQVNIGDCLFDKSSFYLVQCFLGEGSFGKVAKCVRVADMKTVAIKIIKKREDYISDAEKEVSTLLKLKSLDPDKCSIVRWYQQFTDRGLICLAFEHLDKSLYDFIKERDFQPLHLKEIRPIVQQLANAFHHLKAVGLMHTDLKLDNVMLVNHAEEPYRVKLIDFGLACEVSPAKLLCNMQPLPFRAPEVMLALPLTEAVDMWSLGCLAAALYLSNFLYPGTNEYDMMRYIVEMQGMPPDNLLNRGCLTRRFFNREYLTSTTGLWKLKSPEEFFKDSGIQPKETRTVKFSSLDDLLQTQLIRPEVCANNAASMTDMVMFVDLLKGMLELDATKRMTPRQVMEHPFISMSHMMSLYPLSSHVRSCYEIMAVCQKTLASDSETAVSSTTANVNQQNSPAETSHTCTQSTTAVKSGTKRKADDKVGEMYHQSKRHRRSSAGPSTSRSSQDPNNYIQAHADVRSRPTQTFHRNDNRDTSKSSQTQSYIKPGIKRKMADDEDARCQQTDQRKRFQKSSVVPPHSGRSSQTHRFIAPRVKRRMGRDDDDYYERPGQERKRVRNSSADRATFSSRDRSTHNLHDHYERRNGPPKHHHQSRHPAGGTQTSGDRVTFQDRRRREHSNDERRTIKQRQYQGTRDQSRV